MVHRYVRTFRVFSGAWEVNGLTLEGGEDSEFLSVHQVVNGHLRELQEEAGATIISVQAQDTLLADEGDPDGGTIVTTYTVVYEGLHER
jgi:8-oxo-dGTP pyrophosphatase MutT (NUDIX family)